MAGQVRSYADVVVTTLGGAGDPALAELLEAADDVDTELAVPVQLDAALARWTAATEALRDRLVSYVLGEVPVGDLPGITPPPWQAPEGVTLDATVGPLGVHVQAPALALADPRDPAAPLIVIGVLPPSAVRAHLDAGPVVGDGGLAILPDGVNGALSLHLGPVEVAALASLREVGDQPSFAAVLAAGFTPGIQLGFGFQLSRVGGVIGINRAIDQPALAAKLRDGSAGEALFPLDAGDGARRALGAIEAILPPRLHSSVAGPTLRMSWLEISGQGFCSLDLGILIELPGPQRVVIVGIARAGIPPVLKLRIDVLGVVDLQRRLVAIDASLVDSGLLGVFSIYGDAAFRQSWGTPAYTVPGLDAAGPVGLALLDDWAETVAGSRHATHAAFGFDAPRARAPQSVLLAVPPDEAVPLSAATLPGIVLGTRQLARARMAQPDQLGEWSLAVPTSMVLTSGPAGATLVEQP